MSRVLRQTVTMEVYAIVSEDSGPDERPHLLAGLDLEAQVREWIQSQDHGGDASAWFVAGDGSASKIEELKARRR